MQKSADPTADCRAVRRRVRQAAMPTLREAAAAWAAAHARDTGPRYRAELLAAIGRGCGDGARRPGAPAGPVIITRRIDTVSAEDIAGAVQTARARGDGEARYLVRGLRRVFGYALAVGHVQANVVNEFLRREKGGRRSIPWMRRMNKSQQMRWPRRGADLLL
jgi:class 3 adenylate cyclase